MAKPRSATFVMLQRVIESRETQLQALISRARQDVSQAQSELAEAETLCASYDLSRFDGGVSAATVARNQRFLDRLLVLRGARTQELSRAEQRVAQYLSQWQALNQRKHLFEDVGERIVAVEEAEKKRKMRRSANNGSGSVVSEWSMLNGMEGRVGPNGSRSNDGDQ